MLSKPSGELRYDNIIPIPIPTTIPMPIHWKDIAIFYLFLRGHQPCGKLEFCKENAKSACFDSIGR